jgi:hypothetical protein
MAKRIQNDEASATTTTATISAATIKPFRRFGAMAMQDDRRQR